MTAIDTIKDLVAEQKLSVGTGTEVNRGIVVTLRGETYENREAIKAAGFKWNGRYWSYTAMPSRDDEVLMAVAREYTESKLAWQEYMESTTEEERHAHGQALLAQCSEASRSRRARARNRH